MDSAKSDSMQTPNGEQLAAEMLHLLGALTNLSLSMKDLIYEVERVCPSTNVAADTAALIKKISKR